MPTDPPGEVAGGSVNINAAEQVIGQALAGVEGIPAVVIQDYPRHVLIGAAFGLERGKVLGRQHMSGDLESMP